jgi:hypothetical protein
MTTASKRRSLPLIPHPGHLRKQAKARLADMRVKTPTARLSDVQLVLANEYGFANWKALQAEVTRRTSGPRDRRASLRQADLHGERFTGDQDAAISSPMDFFRVGVAAQVGFVFVALTGIALVFVASGPPRGVVATALRMGRPLVDLIHAIL